MADLCRTNPPDATSTGFLPVTGDTPRVLVLGSFPSVKSLLHYEYYGNPLNHFWKIMESLFGIDHQLPYTNRVDCLTMNHIALWDVVQCCTRKGSADEEIREPVFNDICGFLTAYPTINLIVLNGTAAGRYFHRMNLPHVIENCILPSTSPANTRFTLKEKTEVWKIIHVYCERDQYPADSTLHTES